MIAQQTIDEAVRRLVEAASPRKVILFGSYARGDAREQSDLDFLVIEREVANHGREMVRLAASAMRHNDPRAEPLGYAERTPFGAVGVGSLAAKRVCSA